jgi:threonylcarbamoyladenosine tRNA methylthiotransferase MtaB
MTGDLKNKKIWVHTLGCRSNQYEGEALASAFADAGAILADSPRDCDGAALVSCTVTAAADKKCRQAVRKIRRLSPGAVIAACGCWAQKISPVEAQSLGINIVAGNRRKHLVPALMARSFRGGGPSFIEEKTDVLRSEQWDSLSLSRPFFHTRAFVKVQDGCNHFCSYCIIPYVRGRPVNRDAEETAAEIRRLAASGCPEIVLTGVHLGLYGARPLGELVRAVASVEGIKRVRFGSLEPFGLDEELLASLADTPSFCRHLHLPLQSGSPSVLARMKRGYGPAGYLDLVTKARKWLGEDLHVSTDVLVGFPGETDKDFKETLAFMKECRFGKVHVFPYSPREGTEAWGYPDRVPGKVVLERMTAALSLAGELLSSYARRYVGERVEVLAEEAEGGAFRGLTPSFLKVEGEGAAMRGEEVPVEISGLLGEGLKGRRAS